MAFAANESPLPRAARPLLGDLSIEITPNDPRSVAIATETLPARTETFIASLPRGSVDVVVATARDLCRRGLTPVPHIAARNIRDECELDQLMQRLTHEAGVDRLLLIGGDRDLPSGSYFDSLQVLQSGLLQQHGIRKIYLSCYPEGHPRIDQERLRSARREKLVVAQRAGLDATLISQFCFEAVPIVRLARDLRAEGITTPLRVGIAGPVGPVALLKYAVLCGVGPSIRALRERNDFGRKAMSGGTEYLVDAVTWAQENDPGLGIGGIHFFTFGAVKKTATMVAELMQASREATHCSQQVN